MPVYGENEKLEYRAGKNAPDKPNWAGFNGFFGARRAVPINNKSGDIEIVPTPPKGWVRILEMEPGPEYQGEPPASIGQIAEIAPAVDGWAIWQDSQGNEHRLELIDSATGTLEPTEALQSANKFLHLVNGERIIFRPIVPGIAGDAVFLGSWVDTDLDAMRGNLTDSLQVVAQPPRGKTWALPPSPSREYEYIADPPPGLVLPVGVWRSLVFWNFDSIAHVVELYLNDGTNDIQIDTIGAGPWAAGPPPEAGEAWAPAIETAGGLVIPDGSSLKARLTEAPVSGRCLLLAPFREINAAKLALSPWSPF